MNARVCTSSHFFWRPPTQRNVGQLQRRRRRAPMTTRSHAVTRQKTLRGRATKKRGWILYFSLYIHSPFFLLLLSLRDIAEPTQDSVVRLFFISLPGADGPDRNVSSRRVKRAIYFAFLLLQFTAMSISNQWLLILLILPSLLMGAPTTDITSILF